MNKLLMCFMFGVVIILLVGCFVSIKDFILIGQLQCFVSSFVENNIGISGDKWEILISIVILLFSNNIEEQVVGLLLCQVINSQLVGWNFLFMYFVEVDKWLFLGLLDYFKMVFYFGVEGVLVGEVVDFEWFFVGIYLEICFEVVLLLYNIKGDVVWSGEYEVMQCVGGVFIIVWGLLLNVVIVVMNLDDENLLVVVDELGCKVVFDFL